MNFTRFKQLSGDELKLLAKLSGGFAVLLVFALLLQGSIPGEPGWLRLAVNNTRASSAAALATINYTSSCTQSSPCSFTVPVGTNSVSVQLWGAGGNSGSTIKEGSCPGTDGPIYTVPGGTPGAAGYAAATIPVTSGEVLSIVVGTPSDGGSGSGGAGPGGGYSGIFNGTPSQANALVVAGGGGGGGSWSNSSEGCFGSGQSNPWGAQESGGAGGGSAGGAAGISGTGGTQTQGGVAQSNGQNGSALAGGSGGSPGYDSGGGGGAGYWGGAGGGYTQGNYSFGGGGGSGYCSSTATSCTSVTATTTQAADYWQPGANNAGNPQTSGSVILSFNSTLSLSASPTSITQGGVSTLTWSVPSNATQCTITTPGGGTVGSQGLGTDSSVNGGTWTLNNITPANQLVDTPTDNYPTLNQIYYYSPTYTKGIVQAGGLAADGYYGAVAGWQLTSGYWYWEYSATTGASNGYPIVGVWADPNSDSSYRAYPGHNNDVGIGYGANGYTYYDSYYPGNSAPSVSMPLLSTFTNGDVIGVAYDANTGKVYFSKNGVWQNSGNPAAGTGYVGIVKNGWPGLASYYGKTYVNFGQSGAATDTYYSAAGGYFAYPPPSGYLAVSSNNLPTVAVANPSQSFNAITYTGNGAAQTLTVGFQPDIVWIKNRVATYFNTLSDSTRGPASDLFSNSTAPASVNDPNGWVSAFTAQGFTAGGQCTATPNNTNLAGDNYVAWAWKKSPTDGVDVVSYTGNGMASQQIAHALGTIPNMIIVKRADNTGDWYVWTSGLTDQSYFLKLDTTDAQTNTNSPWGGATSGNFTASYFTVGDNATNDLNASGAQYVAYIFSNRAGFSQIGTYVSNGSTDGPFVNTGFKPEFLMVKDLATNNTYTDWTIYDAARDASNPAYHTIASNLSSVENGDTNCTGSSVCNVDLLSNGFKLRNGPWEINAGTDQYVYAAFAAVPFSVASAPDTITIANSLRVDSSNNPSLTRTPSVSGNEQKGTLSFWFKRGQLSGQNDNQILLTTPSRDELVAFGWDCAQDELDVRMPYDGSDQCTSSSDLLRDPSHWYHIVIAYDTTQATPSNRVQVYIDDTPVALTGTYPTQNSTTAQWNIAGQTMSLFHDLSSNGYDADGEVADFYYIDGRQLTPSSFGFYDGNGNWRPAAYTGSFGTNGFHLTFTNGLQLGADSSGLGNNFTTTNFSALDQTADTPTNNFATLDQIYYYSSCCGKGAVQGGGLATNGGYGAASGWQLNSGLWYWENTIQGVNGGWPVLGVWANPTDPPDGAYPGNSTLPDYGYQSSGYVYADNVVQPQIVSAFQNGDVIGMAYNANTGAVYISKNGQWQNGTNLIPQMTGPTTNGVTMSASNTYSSDYPWNAADRMPNTSYWYTYLHVPSAASPDWLEVSFPSGQTVASYSIKNYYGGLGYDPINFQLQGSNNNSTWTTLDTESNIVWSEANQEQYFTVPSGNLASYQYYRLYVTGAGTVAAPTYYLIINEFGLYSSATQNPTNGSIQPIGYTTGGWPGLGSNYGKTYINFGQGGGQATTFVDSSTYAHVMSVVGTAQPSGSVYKFGSASAYFNGSSAMTTPEAAEFNPTGNYTIDLWAYPTALPGGVGLLSRDSSNGYSPYMIYQNGSSFTFYSSSTGGGWDIASAQTICPSVTINTWYHLAVVRSGSTYYTFCNGVEEATWTSSSLEWNAPYPFVIGRQYSGGGYFQGYIDEVRFSNSARWTGGTNGVQYFTPPASAYSSDANTVLLLHMEAANSSFYRSGAGGYFAYPPPSGYMALSTSDITPPTITEPSQYFGAVAYTGNAGVPSYDSVNKGTNVVLSNGNYDATSQTNGWSSDQFYSTNTFSSGKWYAEFKMSSDYPVSVGIGPSSKQTTSGEYIGYLPTEYSFYPWGGCFYNNNVCTTAPNTTATGDVYMVAVDMNAGKVWFGRNGVWENGGNPATGVNPQYTSLTGTEAFAVAAYAGAGDIQANFGQAGRSGTAYYSSAGGYFDYQPPSGFLALPSASSQSIPLNFQPDLVWIKNRVATYSNTLVDSARGAGINLFSNSSGAQTQNDINGSVVSLNTNGFTVGGVCSAPSGNVNTLGNTYVAWAWQKSPTAGIDVESYVGTGSTTQSVTDTLGTTPSLVLIKSTTNTGDWYVGGTALGGGNFLTLDTTNALGVVTSPLGTDLIPVMTGPTTNGVTMSASTYYNGNYQPYLAGDKNINSFWNSSLFSTLSAAAPQWLQVDFGSGNPKTVGAYTITPQDGGDSPTYDPTAFTLQGSNDGVNFTVLDTETPSWVFDQAQTFYVQSANQGNYRYYRLNITGGGGGNQMLIAELNLWQAPIASASTFNVYNNANLPSAQYIAYLFSNRTGFSQFGTYIGNNTSDGPFVYTGFKPAFVMIKDASVGNSYTNWNIYDSARDPADPLYDMLYPNASTVEDGDGYCGSANCPIDFLANGFKVRSAGYWNTNNGNNSYLYAAFAGVPFKSASTANGFSIPYSLNFDASSNTNLSRTLATSPTSDETWTVSMWVKRGQLETNQGLISDGAQSCTSLLYFNTSDQLVGEIGNGSTCTAVATNQVFRDPSAWIHIVWAVDTTQTNSAQRNILYVNGVQVTSLTSGSSYPAQNYASRFDTSGITEYVGSDSPWAPYYFDGEMADVYLIDGQQLTPSSFGLFDSNGFWKPQNYAGTYGQNGFLLNFSSTAATNFSASSGSVPVNPLQTTTYTLQCTPSGGGSGYLTTTATVNVSSAPTMTLTACNGGGALCSSGATLPGVVALGQPASLTWSALGVDANSCTVTDQFNDNLGSGNSANNVSTPAITQPTTYTLQCTVSGVATSTTANVIINNSCTTGTGTAPNSCSNQCAFDTTTNTPTYSGGATLSWCCPAGPSSGANFSTGGALSGTTQVTPLSSTAYTLSCPSGESSITLNPTTGAVPPSAMTLSSTRVRSGNQSTLSWVINGMATGISCSITPEPVGGMPAWNDNSTWSGSAQTTPITTATLYTLTCGNGTASTSASTVVSLDPTFREI